MDDRNCGDYTDYTARVKRKLINSAAIVGVFVILAALGEDLVVILLGVLALILHLLGVLLALLLRRWLDLRLHAARSALWIAAMIALAAIYGLHQSATRLRGNEVVAACEAYRSQHGRYPKSLEALVPGFLVAVPPASDRVLHKDRFRYRSSDAGFTLGYAGVAINYQEYDSGTRRWQLRD